jgi:hypothetical protein
MKHVDPRVAKEKLRKCGADTREKSGNEGGNRPAQIRSRFVGGVHPRKWIQDLVRRFFVQQKESSSPARLASDSSQRRGMFPVTSRKILLEPEPEPESEPEGLRKG